MIMMTMVTITIAKVHIKYLLCANNSFKLFTQIISVNTHTIVVFFSQIKNLRLREVKNLSPVKLAVSSRARLKLAQCVPKAYFLVSMMHYTEEILNFLVSVFFYFIRNKFSSLGLYWYSQFLPPSL